MERKYRILVAEDEELISANIVKKIKALSPLYEIVAIASDGRQALEILQSSRVDLLLTDIRMPIINGLELAEKAKQINESLDIIIISGYAEFTYAQQAIRLGVNDYLLKPIKLIALKEVLEEKYKRFKKAYIYELEQIIKGKQTALPHCLDNTYLALTNIGNICTVAPSIRTISYYDRLWDDALGNHIFDAFGDKIIVDDVFPTGKFFLFCKSPKDIDFREMQIFCENILHMNLSVYYADHFVGYEELHKQASELKILSTVYNSPAIGHIVNTKDTQKNSPASIGETKFLLKEYSELLTKNAIEELKQAIGQHLTKMFDTNASQKKINDYISLVLELLLFYNTPPYEAELAHMQYYIYEKLSMPSSTAEMVSAILDELSSLFPRDISTMTMHDGRQQILERGNLIESVCGYIKEHFAEELTLDGIAGHFRFAPSHLIRLFKNTTGDTPISYLIKHRIIEAKRRLAQNPGADIKQIGIEVGYYDQHYFSRIFKNATGMSPSEYRKQLF